MHGRGRDDIEQVDCRIVEHGVELVVGLPDLELPGCLSGERCIAVAGCDQRDLRYPPPGAVVKLAEIAIAQRGDPQLLRHAYSCSNAASTASAMADVPSLPPIS